VLSANSHIAMMAEDWQPSRLTLDEKVPLAAETVS
jgi:hypothetical protein